MRTWTTLVPTCAMLVLGLAAPAYAHRVNVFAYWDGARVKIEAYFSNGSKAANSDVLVYNADAALRLRTKTDENGECSFAPAASEDLKIVVTTPDGHRAECTLRASDISVPEAQDTASRNDADADEHHTAAAAPCGVAALKAELDATRAELRELKQVQSRISARDVVAGLGFILGATSLAGWLSGKRTRSTNED